MIEDLDTAVADFVARIFSNRRSRGIERFNVFIFKDREETAPEEEEEEERDFRDLNSDLATSERSTRPLGYSNITGVGFSKDS